MKKTLIFVFLAFCFLIFSCKKNKEEAESGIENPHDAVFSFKQNLYQNKLDSVFKKYDFNGSVAVFQDSVLIAKKNAGFRNFEKKIPFDSITVFAIGSVSKQFTAAMILLLEEQEKLGIEDPVSRYLEEFSGSEKKNITIHELMNHSSGINDLGSGLLFQSGTDFSYSNKGYYFLGEIIEKVTGKTYSDNVKELFRKAGMKQSSTADDFRGQDFASAYTGTAKNWKMVEKMPQRLAHKSISVAAGGILSTVNDLHLWNQALYGGKILSAESVRKMTTPEVHRQHPIFGNVGYCFGLMTNMGTPKSFFHSGYVKGSPSLIVYYPETKTSVIILSNIAQDAQPLEKIFVPHREIKNSADETETAATEILKTLANSEQ